MSQIPPGFYYLILSILFGLIYYFYFILFCFIRFYYFSILIYFNILFYFIFGVNFFPSTLPLVPSVYFSRFKCFWFHLYYHAAGENCVSDLKVTAQSPHQERGVIPQNTNTFVTDSNSDLFV